MKPQPGTVVDSSVLLDVFTDDPTWADWSAAGMVRALSIGPVVINAIVLAEVAPEFTRIEALHDALPDEVMIEEIPASAAFLAGHAHVRYRRAGGDRTQILPDFLIAAHAAVTGRRLLTRDPRRVRTHLPGVRVAAPELKP